MRNVALPLIASLALLFCSGHEPVDEKPSDSVGVHVEMVAIDRYDAPVIVLEENEGPRLLHIWIGPVEAQSIAAVMEDRESPRPNTHDLGVRLLHGLDGKIDRVVVNDLRRGVYFAVIALRNGDSLVEIDARPSDAIAIALRVGAPIFVNPALFNPSKPLPRINDNGHQVQNLNSQSQLQVACILAATSRVTL